MRGRSLLNDAGPVLWGEESWNFLPVREAVYVAPPGEEIAVPRLYHGRRPKAGAGDSFYGVRPVVYEAEGIQFFQDAELVLDRNRKSHTRAEMGSEPGSR
jgi:hypothetical protein